VVIEFFFSVTMCGAMDAVWLSGTSTPIIVTTEHGGHNLPG
jgi:hypothetical protein